MDGAPKPKSLKLFMNYVDEYHGINIGKHLAQSVVGASAKEGEEEEEEHTASDVPSQPKDGCYEVFGTMKDPTKPVPGFVSEVFKYEKRSELFEKLCQCDIIIYTIVDDPDQVEEAAWVVNELNDNMDSLVEPKIFILVSTIMTWAKSKPLDNDDLEIPYTEEDYRRRRAHPNFAAHIVTEKEVIKCGKTNKQKLLTYVIASGLTYGAGENIFHYFFKSAWLNLPQLEVFGPGQNVIPTIHVRDLAAVVQNVADRRPKTHYIIAVDESHNTLEEIVKAISKQLTTGKIKPITKEEALLIKEVTQNQFDQLLVSLQMEAPFVKENLQLKWVAETGLVENIATVVKEYKQTRQLLPFRMCILGPPAVGKTTLAKKLCEHYRLHHIKIKDLIDESIANLERSAARAASSSGEEGGGEEDEESKAAEDTELLESINENKAENNGRLDSQFITRFYKDKLTSKPCQNQGFILDGYPKSKEHAEELFLVEENEEEEESGQPATPFNKSLMPTIVIVLDAPDDFLKLRVMQLPESEVAGTHNTEVGFLRRLAEYRSLNNEEDTVLNFFDDNGIAPIHPEVYKEQTKETPDLVADLTRRIGSSRNYSPSPEELAEMRRLAEEERIQREAAEQAEAERLAAAEEEERERRHRDWMGRLEEMASEEKSILETESLPLRNYLMKHVMPVLTQGLMECVRERPDDGVDYLAEYLFRNNPQVD